MNDNSNKTQYLESLAPSYEDNKLDKIYTEQLNHILKEEEYPGSGKLKNKTIAISGGFAAGKSSLIKSYIHNSEYKDKTLYVTLGSYLGATGEKGIYNIEKSILQQIIYSEKAHLFSFSRINRTDKDKSDIMAYSSLFALGLTFLILFMIALISFDTLNTIRKMQYGMNFIATFGLILFFFIWFIFYIILGKLHLSKINIKTSKGEIEANKTESEKESFLNQNIDELIAFFKNNDKEIIVFEDIDRLKEKIELFNKLKEINEILNIAIKNKTIRFIYATSDTIFAQEENRTKYFDILVPVIPYNSYKTSKELLEERVENIDKKDLRIIGNFTSNPRNIKDIVNEYIIFKNNINSKNKNELRKLLYLCSYKVLYPKRFEMLYKKEGYISFYLSLDFVNYVKEKIKEKKKVSINKIIEELQESIDRRREKYYAEFLKYFVDYMISIDVDLEKIVFYDGNNEIIVTYKEIEEDHNNILKLNVEGVFCRENNDTIFDEESIFIYLPKKDFFERLYEDDNITKLEAKKQELKNLDSFNTNYQLVGMSDRLELLKGISTDNEKLQSYLTDKNFDYKLNSFEEVLINEKILDSNTLRMITMKHDNSLSQKDDEVVTAIINNDQLPWDTDIDDPEEVLNELSEEFFALECTNIKKLYKTIVELNLKKYYDKIFSSLSKPKLNFIKMLEESNIKLLEKSGEVNKLWDFISEEDIDDETIYYFLIRTIECVDIDLIDKDSFFYVVLQTYDDVLKHLEENFDKIKKNIGKYKITFDEEVKFDVSYKKMLKVIYDKKMFSINLTQIKVMTESLGLKVVESKLLGTTNKSCKNIYDKLIENFDETTLLISSSGIVQNDSEKFLIKLFSELNLSPEQFNAFIKCEKVMFKDISFIDSNYYVGLLKNGKVAVNWNNVFMLYGFNENKLSDEIISFINSNVDSFAKCTFKHDEYSSLKNAILNCEDISDANYEKLIKSIMKDRVYTGVKNIPTNRLKILIKNNNVRIEDMDNYNLIMENQDLTDKEKAMVISYSYKHLKKYELPNLSSSMMCEILKSNKMSNQEKIDLAFTDYFSTTNEGIQRQLFSILENNKLEVENKNLMELLANTPNDIISTNQKIKVFLNYQSLLDDYDIEKILIVIDKRLYEDIVNKKNYLYIDNNPDNVKFLNILKKHNLVGDLHIRKNKILITYKTK